MKVFIFALAMAGTSLAGEIVDTVDGPKATGYAGISPDGSRAGLPYEGKKSKALKVDLPESFDWREQGVVSPVKDQGNCGSCVSHALTMSLESALAIHAGRPGLDLAEQEIVSCMYEDAFGCDGAYMTAAKYLLKGLGAESDFPYVARAVRCKKIPTVAKALTYKLLGSETEGPTRDEIKEALIKYGPLFVTVYAGGSGWSGQTGKITSCRRSRGNNHAVTLVGYNQSGWIFRNSWGTSWGDKGDSLIGYGCDGFGAEAGFVTVAP